jgi:hypothetical protein
MHINKPVWSSQVAVIIFFLGHLNYYLCSLLTCSNGRVNLLLFVLVMFQVHILTTRATCMFMNLRHLAYEITIFTKDPNSYSGILQLAWYLALARHLETLELHVSSLLSCFCFSFFVDEH